MTDQMPGDKHDFIISDERNAAMADALQMQMLCRASESERHDVNLQIKVQDLNLV